MRRKILAILVCFSVGCFLASCTSGSDTIITQGNINSMEAITPSPTEIPSLTEILLPKETPSPTELPSPTVIPIINEPVSSISPNGKYMIEMSGIDMDNQVFGLYPYEETRLINNNDNSLIWKDMGYISVQFLWSDDSRYVAVGGEVRNRVIIYVVDTQDGEVIYLPDYSSISTQFTLTKDEIMWEENYSLIKWENNKTIMIEFKGSSTFENDYTTSYKFDLLTNDIQFVE